MSTLQRYDSTESSANAPYSLVFAVDGVPVISSVNLADGLGIKHKSLIETIRTYLTQIQRFGHLPFETETVKNSVGAVNESTYCLLNENQALFVGSLSRNTKKVVAFKMRLVEEFDKARKALQHVPQAGMVKLVNSLTDKVISLERKIDALQKAWGNPYVYQATVREAARQEQQILREKIITFVTTRIHFSLSNTWTLFWDKFEEGYNVDIRGLERRKGELTLDAAIRHGYINQIWEYCNIQ